MTPHRLTAIVSHRRVRCYLTTIFLAGVVAGDMVTVEDMMIGSGQLMASSVELEGDDGLNEYGGDSDSESSDGGDSEASDDTTDDTVGTITN